MRFNPDIRAIILRSAVRGIFCAGADLKERAVMKPEDVAPAVSRGRRIFAEFGHMPMPTLVALDGGAYGGGLEISLAADIRVACRFAQLWLGQANYLLKRVLITGDCVCCQQPRKSFPIPNFFCLSTVWQNANLEAGVYFFFNPAHDAKMGLTETRLAIIPGAGA